MRFLVLFLICIQLTACTSKIYKPKIGEETASLTVDGSVLKSTYKPLVYDPEFHVWLHMNPNCVDGYSRLSDSRFSNSVIGYTIVEEENFTEIFTIPTDEKIVIQTSIKNSSFIADAFGAYPICHKYVTFVPQKKQRYLLKLNYSMSAFAPCDDHNIQLFKVSNNHNIKEKSADYPEDELFFRHGHQFKCPVTDKSN